MRPAIFTTFNNAIDKRIPVYQSMVIEKFRDDIPFFPVHYTYPETDFLHGDILNKVVHRLFYERGADCILMLDVDAIPVSKEALDFTFDFAYKGYLVGNAQRSNHIQNNKHVYVAPSYACFSKDTYEAAGCPTMIYNHMGDNLEQFCFNCEKLKMPVEKLLPYEVEAPYNEEGDYWDLADDMPKYGLGTTFAYKEKPISYHLFSARYNQEKNLKRFFNKCHSIIL